MRHYILTGVFAFCLGSALAMCLNSEAEPAEVSYSTQEIAAVGELVEASACDRDDWLCNLDKKRRKP